MRRKKRSGNRPRRWSPRGWRMGWRARAALVGLAIVVTLTGVWSAISHRTSQAHWQALIHHAPGAAFRTHRFAMNMAISLVPRHGPVHYTTETARLDVDHRRAYLALPDVVGPGGLSIVSDGTTLYLSIPASRQARFGGKRWVAVNVGTVAGAQGAAIGPIPDPLSLLASLRGVGGAIHRVGKETVDGIPTTRYDGVVDLAAMAKAVGTDGSSQVQALQRLEPSMLPVSVWLDAVGRPRQLQVRADLGAAGSVVAQVKFGAFGDPLLIGIPPAGAVANAPSVAAALAIAGG